MTARRRPRRSAPPKKARRAGGGLGALVLLLLVTAGAGWAIWTYAGPGPEAKAGAVTVVLPRGAGVAAIADQLAEAGVIRSKPLFLLAAKLGGGTLKAGEYEIPSRASMAGVLAQLRAGRVVRHLITVPEGWTSEMATAAVTRSPVLTGLAVPPPEGSILPETYEVRRGEARAAVLARMHEAQVKLLAELWPGRQPGLPFTTPQEAMTLASIVEKETALPEERPRIAAVYINRLRAGMRLESDPTTIYGISAGRPLGRGITRAELMAATPYNTYQVAGLPPTPIANPGKAAIAAVLDPPKTDELFFVANGQGGHAFAANFAEHQRNVARWREIERQRLAVQAGAAALGGAQGNAVRGKAG
ncbi:endolytic transglycosylase MltG [Phenylobacterium sp. LjRoot225]|uniref:endolytic transglycosylase MltG n=1 Tax=Phenylobacterium sp. LjRoot225 TaxID=3342285 RepID=UPI003ECDFB69